MTTACTPGRILLTHWASAAALVALGLATSLAQAESWPTAKAITLTVGYPAGGSVDLVARIISEPLGKRLGAQIVIDNVPGASGTIGGQKVVNAAPDGYSLLLGSGSEISIARIYSSAVKYNGETDLSPVGLIGTTPMAFVAGPQTGVKNMLDALALAKRNPGKFNFASSGMGTSLHVAGELLNLKAGTSIKHVPYRGAPQMVQDLLGGNIEFGVFVLSSALPHIESGKMVALAVTTHERSRAAPYVPALSELPLFKDYNLSVWFGLFGPAKLPPDITNRLNKALGEVLREPTVWQKLQKAGISNEGGTPQDLASFVKAATLSVRSAANHAIATDTAN
ncbi:MAG: tripartite tricarboxylate transporter substrate binding protein [Polaromonas sp.]|nr:MAG: tripartite tricarboxylate transporter substrate binding protein [Polaromonas sp.]